MVEAHDNNTVESVQDYSNLPMALGCLAVSTLAQVDALRAVEER